MCKYHPSLFIPSCSFVENDKKVPPYSFIRYLKVLLYRLCKKWLPLSVPTMNFVGIEDSNSKHDDPWAFCIRWSASFFTGSKIRISVGSFAFLISHHFTWKFTKKCYSQHRFTFCKGHIRFVWDPLGFFQTTFDQKGQTSFLLKTYLFSLLKYQQCSLL